MTQPPLSTAVTLAEVASVAGVGESTVSRVLRNHGSFSKRTRDRVLAAVDQLGYVPNRIAGTLASPGSPLVAVVIPSLGNIVFGEVLRGLTGALERTGRQAVFAVTDYEPTRESALVAVMLSWRPSAVMLAGLEHTASTLRMLRANGCRVVELLDLDGTPLDHAVGFSNRAAGASSARYLIERGYRKIAYIGHDLERDRRAAKRFSGFCDALAQAGSELVDREIAPGTSSVAAGRAALARLLARRPEIDAVYFSKDDMAIGGYFHCTAAGIAIPEQLALFGFHGLDIAAALPKPLTTIRTPGEQVGRVAGELVSEGGAAQIVDLGFELIPGATA